MKRHVFLPDKQRDVPVHSKGSRWRVEVEPAPERTTQSVGRIEEGKDWNQSGSKGEKTESRIEVRSEPRGESERRPSAKQNIGEVWVLVFTVFRKVERGTSSW